MKSKRFRFSRWSYRHGGIVIIPHVDMIWFRYLKCIQIEIKLFTKSYVFGVTCE